MYWYNFSQIKQSSLIPIRAERLVFKRLSYFHNELSGVWARSFLIIFHRLIGKVKFCCI